MAYAPNFTITLPVLGCHQPQGSSVWFKIMAGLVTIASGNNHGSFGKKDVHMN